LLASCEPWKKVDYIKGFNWLTFYGGKFSTSQKRGIFTNQALDEFQPDYWRYWLMANAPENADSSFTFSSFAATINKDLNDVLGNFINRVLKMTASKIGPAVPSGGEWTAVEEEFVQTLQNRVADYTKYLSEMEFRKALVELRAIWVEGNNYLTAAAPWTVIKEDPEKAAMILRLALNVIRLYSILSAPVIPETAEKIQNLLNLEDAGFAWPKENLTEELQVLKAGHTFDVPEQPLFQKITPEAVADLCARYGGIPEE